MTDNVPKNEATTAPPTAADAQDGTKGRVNWTREHRLAVWANAASFASAGFAAAAFLILLKTLWATQDSLAAAQRQVETAKEANQISSRALAAAIGASVHVGPAEFRQFTEANEETKINIIAPIGNDGGTTTRDLGYSATCTVDKKSSVAPYDYRVLDARPLYRLTVPSRETVRPMVCSYTIKEWAFITAVGGSIYVYGRASYRDTIQAAERHTLEFCVCSSPPLIWNVWRCA